MAEVTITNLGGSIKVLDTRFSPEVTDLTVLKDGLSIKRFGNIVRLTLVEGNWIDIDYSEVVLINFTYSTTPTDSIEFYDEFWKILEDYCDCSTVQPSDCTRLLEDGTARLLEDSSPRLLEEDCSSGGGVWGTITGDIEDQTDLIDLISSLTPKVNCYFNFTVSVSTASITIDIDTAGNYELESFSGAITSATYTINASPATLPFTLAIGDVFEATPDDIGILKLSGYVS
jgi:hypothetical protein